MGHITYLTHATHPSFFHRACRRIPGSSTFGRNCSRWRWSAPDKPTHTPPTAPTPKQAIPVRLYAAAAGARTCHLTSCIPSSWPMPWGNGCLWTPFFTEQRCLRCMRLRTSLPLSQRLRRSRLPTQGAPNAVKTENPCNARDAARLATAPRSARSNTGGRTSLFASDLGVETRTRRPLTSLTYTGGRWKGTGKVQ